MQFEDWDSFLIDLANKKRKSALFKHRINIIAGENKCILPSKNHINEIHIEWQQEVSTSPMFSKYFN